jgi:hypothetical protein
MSFASVRCDSQSSGPVPLPSLGRREKKQPPAGPAKNRAPAVPAEKPLGRAATKSTRRPRLAPLCWRLNRSPTRLNPRGPLRQNRRPPGRSPAPHKKRARDQSAPSPPRLSRLRSVRFAPTPPNCFVCPGPGRYIRGLLRRLKAARLRLAPPRWRLIRYQRERTPDARSGGIVFPPVAPRPRPKDVRGASPLRRPRDRAAFRSGRFASPRAPWFSPRPRTWGLSLIGRCALGLCGAGPLPRAGGRVRPRSGARETYQVLRVGPRPPRPGARKR